MEREEARTVLRREKSAGRMGATVRRGEDQHKIGAKVKKHASPTFQKAGEIPSANREKDSGTEWAKANDKANPRKRRRKHISPPPSGEKTAEQ